MFGVFPEKSLIGTAGVKGKTRVNTKPILSGKPANDNDCLEIVVDLEIDDFALQMPGFTSKAGSVKIKYVALVPVDPTLPVLGSTTKMTLEHEAFGAANPKEKPHILKTYSK